MLKKGDKVKILDGMDIPDSDVYFDGSMRQYIKTKTYITGFRGGIATLNCDGSYWGWSKLWLKKI